MNVQFGHGSHESAKTSVQFGGQGFFDDLRQQIKNAASGEDSVEVGGEKKEKTKKPSNRSVSRGLKRMVNKTLRPRGILELALFPIFLPKHFIEGYFGVSSIILPRVLKIRGYHKDVSRAPLVASPIVNKVKGAVANKQAQAAE